ncbi:MAG TPA: patatin-like phospholipase family protein [Xanthobacteraceae bacterium]|nr:patatin-like phospholipase family protein [Xanthobacteraceae bacterium]
MNKLFSWALGSERPPPNRPQKRVNLALQGGGAHGAFTWGVLDHLLEDGRLGIDGVSGASAGAINAVMLADGLIRGGPEEARKRLADFWRAASVDGSLPGLSRQFVDQLSAASVPMKTWLNSMGRLLSPSHMNPLNINPLKQLIERFADFEALRNSDRELFISATNAQTGDLRLFTRDELTAEAVMASACLPLLFRPVMIDGAPYWDGGYVSNPPLLPFLQTAGSADVLLVQIFPLRRDRAPTSSREIVGRTAEIAFNAPLLAELRGLAAVDRFAGQDVRRLRLHRIALQEFGRTPDAASRLNNDYKFFQALHERGREAAQRFLAAHFDAIGSHGTMDAAAEAEPEYASR